MKQPPGNEYREKIINMERNRDYRGAYDALKEALTVYPAHSFFLKTEIFLLFKLKKITEARKKAEQRIDTLRTDTFFLKTYCMILEKDGAKDDLQRLLGNIISWDIRDEEFYIFLSSLVARVLGQESAADLLKAAIGNIPESEALKKMLNSQQADGNMGSKYNYYKNKFTGKDIKASIEELENIKILPEYAQDYNLHLYLAGLYKKAKKYSKAAEIYKNLLQQKDNQFTRKMLGYVYYKMGDEDNALIYLKDTFLSDPHDHYLYRTISTIFEKRKDFEGFERLITEALTKNPDAKHLYGLLRKATKWQKN